MNPLRQISLALLGLLAAGAASADYTKIANNGAELPASAALGSGPLDWACTRDNVTGLIWEVKTTGGGLRDMGKIYTNYDSNEGTLAEINASINSIPFVNAVNASALCGFGEWRMPSYGELQGLLNATYTPRIDPDYFPNTQADFYWSGTPSYAGAYAVRFSNGIVHVGHLRSYYESVRLVRGGISLSTFGLSVEVTGTGSGRVNTGGINCALVAGLGAGACATARGSGTPVTLSATPVPGSRFNGWGGACAGTGLTCVLTMDADKSVTASYVLPIAADSILVDPGNANILYAGLDGAGVYASTDGGGSWTAINSGLTNLNVRALAIQNSSTLFAATHDGGAFKASVSAGNWSWAACGTLPPGTRLRSLVLDAGGNLYAGSETGVFKGSSACGPWTAMNNGLP